MATKSWKTGINGSWTTAADWTPGAVPGAADDAVISVAGAYTVSATSIAVAAHSLKIGNNRAVLAITGGAAPASLKMTASGSNAGSIVLAGRATLLGGAGFVNNGVIAVNNDVFGTGDAGGGGVKLAGTLVNNGDLDIGNSALATATTVTAAGLSNAAGGTISLIGGTAQATLNITSAAPTALTGFVYIEGNAALEYKSGGIKSIAANSELSLDGAKARVALASAPGTSTALGGLAVNNGILNLENYAAVKTTVGFTNNDTVWIDAGEGDGGSRLTLGGALTNNDFLDIGNDASRQATTVSATSLVNNSSILLAGGAGRTSLVIAGAAPTTLIGSYQLEGNAVIDFGSGGIKTISADAGLLLDGPRARMALGNDTTKNGALAALTGNFGSFTIGDGSVSIAGSLFNGGQLIVDGFGGGFGITNNRGGSNLTIGKTVTNSGILNIGNSGIFLPTTVKAAALVNNTAINLTGAAGVQATLAIAAAAPTTLTGDYFLVGDALLQYGSGAIKAIGALAVLSLDGKLSRVDVAGGGGGSGNVGGAAAPLAAAAGPSGSTALSTLALNAGAFVLADSASVVTKTAFNNTGSLQVDASGAGGSSLTIGGKLTNSGAVTIGNADILTATNVKAVGLANTGAIGLTGAALVQATLNITTAAPTTLTGNFNLKGDALLQYASGAVTGIGLGSSLSLDGAKSRVGIGATAGNTALAKLAANAGTFTLADSAALTTTVAFNNTGATQVDALFGNAGGASLVIGKGLTNAGLLQIGNAGIAKAVKVTAAALTNPGSLQLTGGGAAATLTIASVANSGTISLTSGAASAALKVTGAFGNSSTGSVRVDAGFGGGGSSLTVGGTLTNGGNLTIGNSGLTRATTATAAKLANTGAIDLTGAAAVQATLKVGAAAPATLTGSFVLSGNALLQYASGAITAIGAGSQLSLDGAKARVALAAAPASNSALTKLAANAGVLTLADGASVATLAGIAFNNAGSTQIDTDFGGGGSSLRIGGKLTNSGFNLQVGSTNLAKAATVTAASVANSGSISLASGVAAAALKVAGAFGNTGTVQVDAGFGGGGSGLTIGAALTNSGFNFQVGNGSLTKATTVTAASVANSGAISLTSGTASAALKVVGAFGNSLAGSVRIDAGFGGGGSILTVGGTLTNGGNLTIGNSGMTRATTATATKLANTGMIDLTGAATVQVTLKVGAAAPATLTGNLDLSGNALLQYASGAITAIGAGSQLALDGAKARVALAAAPGSNSALTKLAANAGTLTFADGASLTTLAGTAFNNTGTTRIDTSFGGGGSGLAIGGALKNNGTLQIGSGGLTKAVTVTAASLVNNSFSNIFVQGGTGTNTATLKAAGASTDAGGISISSGGVLALGGKLTVTGSLSVGDGGTVSGGTLSGPGSMTSSAFSTTSRLNNVTIDAGATFSDNGGILTVAGVVVNGVLKGNFTTLDFGKPGTDSMVNVQGFSTIGLANGGANTLTLKDANFAGLFGNPITVNGGGSGNTVSGAGLTGTNAIVVNAGAGADLFTGGAGNDIFLAGGKTKMTGNGGANEFIFKAPGAANIVADFAVSATNEAVVSNAGFSLGLGGASSFPQALPAGLFAANATGSFGSAAQRFAYNTSNGQLRFDHDGSGAASSPQLVATLTSHPTLANLFFVS